MQKIKLIIIISIDRIINILNSNIIKKYLLFYKINNYLNFLLIIILGSNHPRRIVEFRKYLENKKSEINWDSILSKKKIDKLNIFIGDSHGEFYGRNFEKYKTNNHYLTYWTGPTTLLSFCKSHKLLNNIFNFINFIYFINKNKIKKINVIFSFGEIDIRVFFFRAIYINKLFKNEEVLIKFMIDNFCSTIKYINKKTKKLKIHNLKYYFKEIGPTNNILGFTKKKEHEVKIIIQKEKFPTLGVMHERIKWRKLLMQNIKKKKIIKILKISSSSFNKNGAINNTKSIDNCHITDVHEIIKTQKILIKKI
jgi:hypothetical protein